jgi:hypothetical protein
MGDPNRCDTCGLPFCDCPEPQERPPHSECPWACRCCGGCTGTCPDGLGVPLADEPFSPGASKRYRRLLAKARQTNARRDADDREGGKAGAPGDCPLDLHLRTAISALAAGMDAGDWDCVAEGLAMLQDAELRARLVYPSSCLT